MSLVPASIRLLNDDVRALDIAVVDADGNQITDFTTTVQFPDPPSQAALTAVATSTTSAELLAANAGRRQVFIYNDSNATLFVAFAATATSTAFTVIIGKNSQWQSDLNGYTGVISGILSNGTGNARITEVTQA
jgi:hypothetical protein